MADPASIIAVAPLVELPVLPVVGVVEPVPVVVAAVCTREVERVAEPAPEGKNRATPV